MKLNLIIMSLIVVSCNNVNYEYGVKHTNGRHYYDGNIDTIAYMYEEHFKIKYKISHDTCYIFDEYGKLISTSISSAYYLDPNFIYVTIPINNLQSVTDDTLELVIEENNIKRNLKFSYNIKGPYPTFKIKKTSQSFKIFYKELNYKIKVDSSYVFLYLFSDKTKCLKCNYTDTPPLMR